MAVKLTIPTEEPKRESNPLKQKTETLIQQLQEKGKRAALIRGAQTKTNDAEWKRKAEKNGGHAESVG